MLFHRAIIDSFPIKIDRIIYFVMDLQPIIFYTPFLGLEYLNAKSKIGNRD